MARAREFLFTMTTGRSGTKYLAELLRQNLADAECEHEILGWDRFGVDAPDISHMTLFNSLGNVPKVQSFWQQKLARIAAAPAPFYAETSHLLMKSGLIENLAPLLAAGRVHLVMLERDPFDTVMSFRSRHDFDNRGNMWVWYLDPEYPKNLVQSERLVALGLDGICLWYILEIRTRAAYYARLLGGQSGIVLHRATLEDIAAPAGAARLLAALGAPKPPERITLPPAQNANLRHEAVRPDVEARFR
ncbi:MAG TPA: hypothetical protein VMU42_16295, partial [Candidatus Sulfotelmatobacter sp.]|nr:hypothetical protein [Candidatus Sulfotelmatobacter sp.]